MSTGARIPLADALKIAADLIAAWEIRPADVTVVGSVRRRVPTVRDIEICVSDEQVVEPVPAIFPAEVTAETTSKVMRDPLHDRIARYIARDGWHAVRGLKPGFKYAQIVSPQTTVEVHRPWLQGGIFWARCHGFRILDGVGRGHHGGRQEREMGEAR